MKTFLKLSQSNFHVTRQCTCRARVKQKTLNCVAFYAHEYFLIR